MNSLASRVVRQILVGAASHDAITNIALELSHNLGPDWSGGIFSWFQSDDSVANVISHVSAVPEGSRDDVIVYHLSYGIPALTEWLKNRPEQIVIWYHNVTPAKYFTELAPEFAAGLEHGRQEIKLIRDRTILAIADSHFNAAELHANGYEDVIVSPPRLSVTRLDGVGADSRVLGRIWESFSDGYLLVVAQLLPHKRADHAVSVLHLLRKYFGLSVGLVWAGPARQPLYKEAIEEFQRRLNEPGVMFLDVVTDAELAALYRGCVCFVSFSEHEGLSLPPLEAMANRAPVIVRGAGAVPETVGEGALVVPQDVGLLEFAGLIAHVVTDEMIRSELRIRGDKHLRSYGERSNFAETASRIVACAR